MAESICTVYTQGYGNTAEGIMQLHNSCGSGGERVCEIGGSNPGSSSSHLEVTLGKTLNPKVLQKAVASVCECVCEWVTVGV